MNRKAQHMNGKHGADLCISMHNCCLDRFLYFITLEITRSSGNYERKRIGN